MPLHELLLQEIQQFVDQTNRQLREASEAHHALLQARWQALAVSDDLARLQTLAARLDPRFLALLEVDGDAMPPA